MYKSQPKQLIERRRAKEWIFRLFTIKVQNVQILKLLYINIITICYFSFSIIQLTLAYEYNRTMLCISLITMGHFHKLLCEEMIFLLHKGKNDGLRYEVIIFSRGQ